MVKKAVKIALVVFAVCFVFFMAYYPHFAYRFPFHVDEWKQIEEARKLDEGSGIRKTSVTFEIGFTFIVWILSKFTDIILFYKFLPAMLAVITSFILFYFLRKRVSYWVGLAAMFFFVSLPSNVNLLGIWFFVPVIAAIPFMYASLFLADKAFEENKPRSLIYAAILLAMMFFIHPPSSMISLFTIFLFFIKKKGFVKNNWRYFLAFIALLIPVIFFLLHIRKGNIYGSFMYALSKYIIFPASFGVLNLDYNLIILYGIISMFFALVGIWKSWDKKELKIFLYLFAIILVNFIIFTIFNASIFAHYQRLIYYFMISLVPFSAIGFVSILEILRKSLRNIKKSINLIPVNVMITAIVLLIIYINFSNYAEVYDPAAGLYGIISEKDYEDLTHIASLDISGKILAPLVVCNAIYPITGKETLATLVWDEYHMDSLKKFYSTEDCNEKKDAIRYKNVDYVYARSPMECDFLELEYEGNYHLYKVTDERIK